MTKIAIIGKIDVDNFGDLLLARIFVDRLKRFNLQVVCSGVSPSIAKQIHVDEVGPLESGDAVLFIGGGYFGEPPGRLRSRIRWGNERFRSTILPGLRAAANRKPIAIIGPGYGPLSNIITRLASLILFRSAKFICLRDKESVSFYRQYGGRREVVETADCAIAMTSIALQGNAKDSLNHWRSIAGAKKLVGLNLTKQAIERKGGDFIVEEVSRLLRNPEYKLVFFTDQRATPGACETIDFYRDRFGAHVAILDHPGIDELTGFLQACDLVVTTKLHVGIVSVARGTTVLSFPYHTKTIRFYNQIGRSDLCLPCTEWTQDSVSRQFIRVGELAGEEIYLPESLIELSELNMKVVEDFVVSHVMKDNNEINPDVSPRSSKEAN